MHLAARTIALAAALSFSLAASAEEIALANPGFEADALVDAGQSGKSWHFGMQDWGGSRQGIMRPDVQHFPSGLAPGGRNVAFLSYAGSWMEQQATDVLRPETHYSLQVLVGARADGNFAEGGNYTLALYAGNSLLAEQTSRTAPGGQLVLDSLEFVSGTKPPAEGQPLKVRISNVDARQVNFDNVSLRIVNPDAPAEPVPEWETIGYWTYDEVDGMRLADGLVLRPDTGGILGHTWQYKLELTTHAALLARQRMLWPVSLNRTDKRVCIDAPYPSYIAHIDLPGEAYDGVYAFGTCKGGF
ncbi:MAG: hypothetical protein KDA53_17155 [Hyphomonas sp.]|nr:hypothetical protein [Hyphomonas sp.]